MMIIAGLICVGIAALIHVYIFYMESIAWTSERVRATFAMPLSEAEATKEMAHNQGFYNLFLAISVFVGIGFYVGGHDGIGAAMILTGSVSMVGAATVLLLSSPEKSSAALKQGVIPLVGTLLLAIGMAI